MMISHIPRLILLLIIYVVFSSVLTAQVNQVRFGKNRVQYTDDMDQWLFYETDYFKVYWYGKSRNVGTKIVRLAELEFNDIIKTIDFKTNDKTEFLVFADLNDMKQSNVGIDEAFLIQDALTKTEGNKIFIYYDGNHNHLRRQIRQGVASVFLNNILFGSNLQEIVQNSIMLNLPTWYKDGLISFFGDEWSSEVDLMFSKLVQENKYKSFESFAKEHPRLAGHLFWNYISFNYGRNTIGNLIYYTRIHRSLDRGFQYVLGTNYRSFLVNVWNYYMNYKPLLKPQNTYIDQFEPFKIVKKKREDYISSITYAPDGKHLVIVSNKLGRVKVNLVDLMTKKSKVIYKYGHKNRIQIPDYSYPVVTWSGDSKEVFLAFEKRNFIYLRQYDLKSGDSQTQLIPDKYYAVYGIAWWDKNNIILNANSNGYNDIFLYKLKTRHSEAITNDPYDELDISIVQDEGQRKLLFASNRPGINVPTVDGDSILPVGPYDIYSVERKDDQWKFDQLTNTPDYSEYMPMMSNGELYYLNAAYHYPALIAGKNGVVPKNLIIRDYTINPQNQILISGFNGVETLLYQIKNSALTDISNEEKEVKESNLIGSLEHSKIDTTALEISKQTVFFPIMDTIPENIKFRTEFEDMVLEEPDLPPANKNFQYKTDLLLSSKVAVNRLNIVPYRLQFKITDAGARFDNSLLFDGYSTFAGDGANGLTSPMGLLLKAELKDILEDYRVEGGIRIPVVLNGNEVYLIFDDLKYRLDKRIAFYRKTFTSDFDLINLNQRIDKNIILFGQYEMKYPIDIYNSFKVTGTIRQDKTFFKATEINTLDDPTQSTERIGLRAAYVYDDSYQYSFNILHGVRLMAFGEWVKKFDINTDKGVSIDFNKGSMWVAGFDARNYLPILKHSVFATRIASQMTFGSEKILYYLGGVDGWLFPSFNETTQTSSADNYAFQVPAANLRGFQYNVRNGSSFALVNTELRIPFVKYLAKRPIQSSFLNSLQVVGFFDIGSAWIGSNPFSKFNPQNTYVIDRKGIKVTVNYFRNPIVYGYGAGIRFLLFGYLMRVDYAKGVDTGNHLKPRLHVSLGLDF